MTGPNSRPIRCGALALDGEQPDQDRQGHRQDERLEAGGRELQPLHRRQHRNRRRDHPVAIQQRRADDAEDHRHRDRAGPAIRRLPSTSDSSARMPPSPSLSARNTNCTYLSDTISISAQKISETMPLTSAGVGAAWPVALSAIEKA